MASSDALDPQLIDEYLSGLCSDTDRARVEAWLATRPEMRAMVRELPDALVPATLARSTDASWAALVGRIKAAGDDVSITDLTVHRARTVAPTGTRAGGTAGWARRATRIAAALAVVVGGATVWRVMRDGGELVAPLGREVAAALPDGSRIRLAPGSRIAWTSAFGGAARDLELDGEAWFDVVHDAKRPFRVHSRNAVAEDIGTRFVVRAWLEQSTVEVAVEQGSVALADSGVAARTRGTVLTAGQRASLTAVGAVTVSTSADALLAWTRGELQFDHATLPMVAAELNRRFNVSITYDAALATRTLSARFTAQALPDVLSALELSLGVRAQQNGSAIRLSSPLTQ
jgi:transmembrane sensor